MCSDSYPLGLGVDIQSLSLLVSDSYSSVTYENTFQHNACSVSLSVSQSIMNRIANTSKTPSKATFCFCIFLYMERAVFVLIFSLYDMPSSESFCFSGSMNCVMSFCLSRSVLLSLLVMARYCSGSACLK